MSRINYKFICIYLIVALFLNSALPAFAIAKQAELKNDNLILICTSKGIKYISLDQYNKDNLPEKTQSKSHCPLCIINPNSTDTYTSSYIVVNLRLTTEDTTYYKNLNSLFLFNEDNYWQLVRAPPYLV